MLKVVFPYATVEYIEPVIYFRVTKGGVLDGKMIKDVIDAGLKLCNNQPHVLLTDARISADLTTDARRTGASKENTKNLVASAIVVKWLAQRLSANVFIAVNKPHYPTMVFNDEKKAMKWLMEKWKERK